MRVFASLVRVFIRTAATRARVVGFVIAGAVAVLVAWRIGAQPTGDRAQRAFDVTDVGNLSFLAPVAALVFGASVLGDPAEDGTLIYLWLRPVSRRVTGLAACVAALVLAIPAAVVPAVLAQVALGPGGTPTGSAAATALATAAYTTVFVLVGLVTSRSLVWGIAYLLIFEQFIARGGKSLGAFSVHAQAVSIVAPRRTLSSAVAYFTPASAAAALIVVASVGAFAVAWQLDRADVA